MNFWINFQSMLDLKLIKFYIYKQNSNKYYDWNCKNVKFRIAINKTQNAKIQKYEKF